MEEGGEGGAKEGEGREREESIGAGGTRPFLSIRPADPLPQSFAISAVNGCLAASCHELCGGQRLEQRAGGKRGYEGGRWMRHQNETEDILIGDLCAATQMYLGLTGPRRIWTYAKTCSIHEA